MNPFLFTALIIAMYCLIPLLIAIINAVLYMTMPETERNQSSLLLTQLAWQAFLIILSGVLIYFESIFVLFLPIVGSLVSSGIAIFQLSGIFYKRRKIFGAGVASIILSALNFTIFLIYL
ncbi:MAG: hypothetical protein RR060_05790 [Victivallaceae bacterium]